MIKKEDKNYHERYIKLVEQIAADMNRIAKAMEKIIK